MHQDRLVEIAYSADRVRWALGWVAAIEDQLNPHMGVEHAWGSLLQLSTNPFTAL